ncbi:MAG: hypothetical protein GWN30_21025, partial [Gammaproteobacteria bacterium]|nr:hypothetical protein [Gammaproteobacteria bacterium]NIX00961.1 hypothetical protein [Phycisphaerae bacterium]
MVTLKHHHIYSAKPLYQVLMGFCLFLVIAGSLINCSSTRFKIPPSVPDDRRPVPQPRPRKINLARDVFEKQFFDQLQQFLDISRHYRKISGDNKQAYNVNAFDEVANSSWFTNRNHVRQLSLEEIARGPNTGYPGPDTSGAWTITRVKVEGVTPGFTIRDKHGVSYLIKFEPPGYTEMVSGAEVVSTKLFYAAGYNVPQNYIVYFHPNILELSDNVKIIEDLGRERYMTDADLEEILNRIDILPDGRIRAAA